jgi:hypothetical protein
MVANLPDAGVNGEQALTDKELGNTHWGLPIGEGKPK